MIVSRFYADKRRREGPTLVPSSICQFFNRQNCTSRPRSSGLDAVGDFVGSASRFRASHLELWRRLFAGFTRKSSGVVRMMGLNWLVSKWRFSLSSSRQHETTVLTVSKERREDYTLIVLGFLDSAAVTHGSHSFAV
jgi:hypothetical protein